MPYDRQDYPSSLKNLNEATRVKAIDIINAMLDEGYEEGQAIPIGTEQAKEWYENASNEERQEVREMPKKDLKEHDDNYESRPELLEKGVKVEKHEDGWAVISKTAKQAANVYDTKQEAVKRGQEIAKNKGTFLEIQNEDGHVVEKRNYEG